MSLEKEWNHWSFLNLISGVRNILQNQGSVPDKRPLCHSMTYEYLWAGWIFWYTTFCKWSFMSLGPCWGLCPWLGLHPAVDSTPAWVKLSRALYLGSGWTFLHLIFLKLEFYRLMHANTLLCGCTHFVFGPEGPNHKAMYLCASI